MDIFSHSLWTGLIYRKEKKIWWPIIFSVAPDLFSNGIYFIISLFKGLSVVDSTRVHLNPAGPEIIRIFYSISHSLVFFAIVFIAVWLFLKKPWWPLAAWGIHILIDIPFHSVKYFATPFLYPFSSFGVDSINWGDNNYILALNFIVLAVIYFALYITKNKRKHFTTYLNAKRKLKKL